MKFELGKMDFGTILDRGIKLFKNNFVPMVILMAIFFGPFTFATNVCLTMMEDNLGSSNVITDIMDKFLGNPGETEIVHEFKSFLDDPELLSMLGLVLFLTFLLLAITPLVYLGVFRILSEHILGRTPSTGEVIRFAASRFWTLIGAIIICNLIFYLICMALSIALVGIGAVATGSIGVISVIMLLFFFVIALALMIFHILLPCVVCMEDVRAMKALKRTWWLLRGFWWRTFGIYFLAALLVGIITQIFLSVGQGIGGLIPGIAGNAFVATVSTLFTLIFQPFTLTIIFLIYLDIRIRKENFDLDILASRSFNIESDKTVPAQNSNEDTWK